MILIDPVAITPAMLVSTNVPETDYAAWSSATTYAAGDRVISTTTHKVYQSKVGSNLNHDPTTDTAGVYWGIVGATNRWKAFDNRNSDKVIRAGSIQYVVTPGHICSGLAIFGLIGETVTVSITDSVDGLTFSQTYPLINNSFVSDWWTWLYAPIQRNTELVIENLPLMTTGTITITVTDTSGGTCELGEIIMGYQWSLGDTEDQATIGITDYSTKEIDAYGNVTLTERRFASTVDFNVAIPAQNVSWVQALLASKRAVGAAYHDGAAGVPLGLTVFGFYKDFQINLVSQGLAHVTIQIEGLV